MSWRKTDKSERGRGRGYRARGSQYRGTWNQGSRSLENIASVSRSSGLNEDGDALKNFKTQEEYRDFIQSRLESFWKRPAKERQSQQTLEMQENLLILFRKLREGIVSSKRNDKFSVEVYETSLYLATLFDSSRQLSFVLPYFIPHPSEPSESFALHSPSVYSVPVALINQLSLGYPSQSSYRQSLHSVSGAMSSEVYRWILNVSTSVWTRNFSRFEKLTRQSYFQSFLENPSPSPLSDELKKLSISSEDPAPKLDLAHKALCYALDTLRSKVRTSTWNVIRSSYRELACNADSGTRDWLLRSLALTANVSLDDWLEERRIAGHIRPKEGVEGRWIVFK